MNNGLLGWPQGGAMPDGMLGWPLGLGVIEPVRHTMYYQSAGASFFDNLTAPAGANAKASTWTTIAAVSDHDADGIYVWSNSSSTQSSFLLDIAVGPAGGEVPIVENVCLCGSGGAGGGTNAHNTGSTFLPTRRIPVGSRISARVQCSTGSQTIRTGFMIAGGGFYSMLAQYLREGVSTTVGAATASSGGTSVDPGGSANAKGSWTDLGHLEQPMRALVISTTMENSAPATAYWRMDLARGTEREIIVPDFPVQAAVGSSNSGEGVYNVLSHLIFCDLQAGDILGARLQCSITDATDRLLDVAVTGFS